MQSSILVVDDDPDMRDFVAWALEDQGLEVRLASSGSQALDALARETPVLVLLDVQMPVMDGWEVLRKLRVVHPDLPVVMMSADEAVEGRARRCSVSGF